MHALAARVAATPALAATAARRAAPLRAFQQHPLCARSIAAMASPSSSAAATPFIGPGSDELRSLCVGPCSRDTPLLPRPDLDAHLAALPSWTLSPDGTAISRSLVARNFDAALAFFSAIAPVANAAGHHPDLHLTNFRDVTVTLQTHAVGGVTLADVALAARIDAVPVECSPKWLREQGLAPAKE